MANNRMDELKQSEEEMEINDTSSFVDSVQQELDEIENTESANGSETQDDVEQVTIEKEDEVNERKHDEREEPKERADEETREEKEHIESDDDDDDDEEEEDEFEEDHEPTITRGPEDLPHIKLGHLDRLIRRKYIEVTNIRLDSDDTEQERRIRTENHREDMQQKLVQNSIVSSKRNAAISMQWPRVARMRTPMEMQIELEAMEQQCEKVIQSKDRLIQELINSLRDKDAEYVKALRSQEIDMGRTIERMHNAISEIVQENEETLGRIESEFMEDRKQLLERNNAKQEQFLETRRVQEKSFARERRVRVDKQVDELEQDIELELEKYAVKKKELDDAMHILEQGIDDMRGFYQLSLEQLNHFHSTAIARVNENETAWRNNKTKLAKLQDQLSGIKAKYARDDKKYKHINNELTEQFSRLAKQYKDLLVKFKFFEENDTKQYNDVWKMKQEMVQEMAEKLLDADKVITEEILGMEWAPPAEDPFRVPGKISGNMAGFITERSTILSDAGSKTISASGFSTQSATEAQPIEVAKKILEMIGDSADFLVEDKVRNAIAKLGPEEGNMLKVDSILRAMGLENPDEIDKLMSFFVKESSHIDELQQFEGDKDPDGSVIVMIHGTNQFVRLISQQNVVRVLRRFVEEQQRSTMNYNIKKRNRILNAEERRRDRKRREEREYWQRIANVIPESTFRIWKTLESGMEKYEELLIERANLLDECDVIRTQNNELRSLLISYSNSKINEELHAPPMI